MTGNHDDLADRLDADRRRHRRAQLRPAARGVGRESRPARRGPHAHPGARRAIEKAAQLLRGGSRRTTTDCSSESVGSRARPSPTRDRAGRGDGGVHADVLVEVPHDVAEHGSVRRVRRRRSVWSPSRSAGTPTAPRARRRRSAKRRPTQPNSGWPASSPVSTTKLGRKRRTSIALSGSACCSDRSADVVMNMSGNASRYVPGGDSNSMISGGNIEKSGSGSPPSRPKMPCSSAIMSSESGAPRR